MGGTGRAAASLGEIATAVLFGGPGRRSREGGGERGASRRLLRLLLLVRRHLLEFASFSFRFSPPLLLLLPLLFLPLPPSLSPELEPPLPPRSPSRRSALQWDSPSGRTASARRRRKAEEASSPPSPLPLSPVPLSPPPPPPASSSSPWLRPSAAAPPLLSGPGPCAARAPPAASGPGAPSGGLPGRRRGERLLEEVALRKRSGDGDERRRSMELHHAFSCTWSAPCRFPCCLRL